MFVFWPVCPQRSPVMLRSTAIKILILLFFSVSAGAQKLKYKDIYGLLSTKQYGAAEPFLKKYIATEKDNPNAFLFMGLVYHEKSAAMDVLKQTPALLSTIDSAILFYDKAAGSIDAREIKRNREYYEAYNRRDLRSGEFGVSLSDIQFDLQKKKETLAARALTIKMVKHYFVASDSLYAKCRQLYETIKDRYPTEQALYLTARDTTVSLLSELASRFDSTLRFVRLYQSSMGGLGNAAYRQEIDLRTVNDYGNDGDATTDFFAERISLWDYSAFAQKVTRVIAEEITPLRKKLVALSVELDSLAASPHPGPRADALEKVAVKFPYPHLKKFDPDPFPLHVLELKLASLRYHDELSVSSLNADSADVNFQLSRISAEAAALAKFDSMLRIVGATDLVRACRLYQHFVKSVFADMRGVEAYVREVKEYVRRETGRVGETMQSRAAAVHWIRLRDDSVPLVATDSLLPYLPLVTENERYTVGLKFLDSTDVSGYFYSVTPSRIPDMQVIFPVDASKFLQRTAPVRAMTTDSNDLVYFVLIYSDAPEDDKFPATIAKIYRGDGLSWSANCSLDFIPETIVYNADSGDLELAAGEAVFVLDKQGKVRDK